jgi:hypothetical protein
MMADVPHIQTAHTADVDAATLKARGLLDLVSELTCDWRDGDVW